MEKDTIAINNIIDYIVKFIPSKEVGQYIVQNKDKYSVFQLATLVEEYVKSRKSECFAVLKEITTDLYEKELLNRACNDYKKHKWLSEKTNRFYEKNDPRLNDKPSIPFCEICDLPIIFKEGEIVALQDGDNIRHAVIGLVPNPQDYCDFDGPCSLAYMLDEDLDCNDCLFKTHAHLHVCEVNRSTKSKLTEFESRNLDILLPIIKEFCGWPKK